MSLILLNTTGSPNSKSLARGLMRSGLLQAYVTAAAVPEVLTTGPWQGRLTRELRRRTVVGVPWQRIRTTPLREAARLLAQHWRLPYLAEHERGWASIDAVNGNVSRRAARLIGRGSCVKGVYAYEDCALEAFTAASAAGIRRIYELPVAGWRAMRAIYREEADIEPAWASTLDGLRDSPGKLDRKDQELALADQIVVPCSYVARCVSELRPSTVPIHVVPYGAPSISVDPPARRAPSEPLRVVFVGQLRQNKGIAYLLRAVDALGPSVQLTLIGRQAPSYSGAASRMLAAHTVTGPLGHQDVLCRIAAQHVMVFPSLAEGFGLVILEAMSQGVPVITTPHTAGPDIIEDGVDGFIVPIRNPDAIGERLLQLRGDEDRRMAIALAAKRKAARLGWARYEATMVDLVRQAIGSGA